MSSDNEEWRRLNNLRSQVDQLAYQMHDIPGANDAAFCLQVILRKRLGECERKAA